MFEKRNGRPSIAEQIGIQKQLWPFFEQQYKTSRVASETGINVKTVRKYFRIWYSKFIFVQDQEFFKNCRISNGRTILELEDQLVKLEKRAGELEAAIESSGSIQEKRWMYSENRKTQELLSKLYVEKNHLESTATADVTLKKECNEILKERMESGNATS